MNSDHQIAFRDGVATPVAASGGRLGSLGYPAARSGVAIHEAGHCVTAVAAGLPIRRATIDPEIAGPGKSGCVWLTPNNYSCLPLENFSDIALSDLQPMKALSCATRVLLFAKTINFLAGAEAERLLLPDQNHHGCDQGDMRAARFLANLFDDPEAFLDHARADAARILSVQRCQVEAIVAALLERKTLSGSEIDDILSDVTPALRAERARRKLWGAMSVRAERFRMMTGGVVRCPT